MLRNQRFYSLRSLAVFKQFEGAKILQKVISLMIQTNINLYMFQPSEKNTFSTTAGFLIFPVKVSRSNRSLDKGFDLRVTKSASGIPCPYDCCD